MELDEAGAGGRQRWAWIAAALAVAGAAIVLIAMGRPPICTCGTVKLWAGAVHSADNSQHIADWYTPSHIIHGLLFYWATGKLLRGRPMSVRLLAAVLLEAAWEIAENSPAVIDRYREATMALGYTGDSVLNSVADIAWMAFGFLLAARVPWRASVALAILFEVGTLLAIRDNLTLNVLMLVAPSDAIKEWQSG